MFLRNLLSSGKSTERENNQRLTTDRVTKNKKKRYYFDIDEVKG